jgi:ACS family glucarate transporter-like MFS transporter
MTSQRTSHIRWLLIFWLFVLSAVAYLDRVNLSIAGGKISEEFSISNIRLGWIFSAFLVGYGLFQTPAGWFADRFGPRRVLTAAVLWWGLFSALTAVVSRGMGHPITVLIAIRFLLGAGEAIIYPSANQFVARWIPSHERGVANGIIFAGVGIGAGLTPPLISYVMSQHGWRASFWMCALIGVLAGAVWLVAARDTPIAHPLVSPAELNLIERGTFHATAPPSGTQLLPWSTILTSGNVWTLSLAYFCFGYVAWIFFGWFFLYLAQVRGLNLKASAFYATLPFLAMAVCSPAGGAFSDWLTKRAGPRIGRCAAPVAGFALTAVFVVLGSIAEDTRIASVVLAGGAGSLYLAQSSFWALSADLGGKSSGSVSGFMNMANQIGGAITLSLTPFLAKAFGWNAGFHVAAVIAVVGAVAWLFVDPRVTLSASESPGLSRQRETA